MGPRGRITHVIGYIVYILHILDCLGQDIQDLYLGRAPCTKETLPDFLKWRRVTRPPLVFRKLTGSQRTPEFWCITISNYLRPDLWPKVSLKRKVLITKIPSLQFPRKIRLESSWNL